MPEFTQPAEDGAEVHTQAALFPGHQVAPLLWGVCPTHRPWGRGEHSKHITALQFIQWVLSRLCPSELEVRPAVPAPSIRHPTRPGPGAISQVGRVARGDVGPPLPAQG